ncbi:DUF11 domain-containing protein [Micromonospora coerulea]|uniref:DUF11 domain-containing protein n=1 Tax=Micromonospora coerulea TaxID=47856 RepID=UPI001905D2E6|nr:DUF11 domain-containing protein [Micromonospora veneta]
MGPPRGGPRPNPGGSARVAGAASEPSAERPSFDRGTSMLQYRTRRIIRTGLAILALTVAPAAVLPSGPALAAPPPRADLQLDLTAVTPVAMIQPDGALVHLRAAVNNIGAAGVDDLTVTLKPPAGSRIVGDPSWQCDYTTFVCVNIYGPVPAGGTAEPLSIYLSLPAGAAGTVATVSATAATSAREASRTNNTDRVSVTYQPIADLTLLPGDAGGVYPEVELPISGGDRAVTFTVRNDGTGTAQDLRLVIEWPEGVTRNIAPVAGTTNWQCEFAATSVVCTAGPLAPGSTAGIYIPLTFPAGTLDQRIAVHGSVTTSGPEWQTDSNNVADAWFRYAEI